MAKKLKGFKKLLVGEVSIACGCAIQYNGCPCNSCFHTWAEDDLGLDPDLAHMFWLIVLALRGDYKPEELLESNIDNFKKIIKRFKK